MSTIVCLYIVLVYFSPHLIFLSCFSEAVHHDFITVLFVYEYS